MPAFMQMNLSHAIRMERAQRAGTGRLRFLARKKTLLCAERMAAQPDNSPFVFHDWMAGYEEEPTVERPSDTAYERRLVAESTSSVDVPRSRRWSSQRQLSDEVVNAYCRPRRVIFLADLGTFVRLLPCSKRTPISRPESRIKEVRRKQLRQFTATTSRHLHSCKH